MRVNTGQKEAAVVKVTEVRVWEGWVGSDAPTWCCYVWAT